MKLLRFLDFIKMLTHTILNFLGLSHYIEPEITWPEPESESKSISATLIQEMLPVMKYSDIGVRGSGSDEPESCVVCMYEFRDHELIRRLRSCKHVFHKGCVDRWMEHDQRNCPLCRTSFVPDHLLDFFNQRLEEVSASCSCFPDFGSEFSVINNFL